MTAVLDAAPSHTPRTRATTEDESAQRDALAMRLFQSSIGAFELLTVYLGDKLGLYRALADGGALTPPELAARAGIDARYAREWLEQQAVAGLLDVDSDKKTDIDPDARRFRLPVGHAEVLLEPESLSYVAPLAQFAVALPRAMPRLLEAYRTGGGVTWAELGPDAREGQAAFNRPAFVQLLGTEWLPSIPDVHARLLADTPARVADIACGAGWSSIAIARAYPNARVDGYDLDAPSIDLARRNAAEAGVADRVTFHVRDASEESLAGTYDLAVIFEALHDMAYPADVLRTMRRLVGSHGTVLVVDERADERFTAPGDEVQRSFYAYSTLCCLATGIADGSAGRPSAATGTVMRPATLKRYAQDAGFTDAETLPIEHDFFRFYRLS